MRPEKEGDMDAASVHFDEGVKKIKKITRDSVEIFCAVSSALRKFEKRTPWRIACTIPKVK